MNITRIVLALVIATLCSCSSFKGHGPQGPVISNLRAGETVEMKYSSIGCFGGSQSEMIFSSSGGQIQASGDEIRGYGNQQQRIPLTPIVLTSNDVQRLEKLIRAFRTPPSDDVWRMSTTTSTLSLTKRSGSKVHLQQSLNDSMGNSINHRTLKIIDDLRKRMPQIRIHNQGQQTQRTR